MSAFTLSLVIHNHQPVGNFDFVFAAATERSYDPLLDALERHPGVRLALHYSGPLLDWLGAHRPDHLARLRALVARQQVDLLTGAYYEPILVAIPHADQLGQVRKMTRFLEQTFGCQPGGAWLAERVWEPHLAWPLAESGVRYTLLDDTPFKMAGLADDDLHGPYITEEQGHTLTVFGNSTYLRYAVPWRPVEEVLGWLRAQAQAHPGGVAVMGDDGEKFGLWPGTWEYCWGAEGWMERFFAALQASSDWLATRPLGEVAASHPPLGRIYLPCASYEEMMRWALPPEDSARLGRIRQELAEQGREDVLRFVKGGLWRAFLARYDEANQMHKKMLWVGRKVHHLPEGEVQTAALEHLWAAQCNCGYWHGLFGGVYLFHIRVANYAHLIAAEEIADRAAHPATWAGVEKGDLDADGHEEVVLNTDRQVLVCKPSCGGALVEWDWRQRRYNLLNAMTRRREGYHQELLAAAEEGRLILPEQEERPGGVRVKGPDIHTRLFHDDYRRAMLLDHFLPPDVTLETFYSAHYNEQGDFVARPYTAQVEKQEESVCLTLRREGTVWLSTVPLPLHVEKAIAVRAASDELAVRYRIRCPATPPPAAALRFGVEIDWGIVGGDSEHGLLTVGTERRALGEMGEQRGVEHIVVGSTLPELAGLVALTLSRPATLWHFPLEAVARSEAGYERAYQGTCTLLWWSLRLEDGQPWEVTLQFALAGVTETGALVR